jgi:hypothetical protein
MKHITIEASIDAFTNLGLPDFSLIETLDGIRSFFRNYDIEPDIVFYDGLDGTRFTGGREREERLRISKLRKRIRRLNRRKKSFMLTLNGGLRHQDEFGFDDREKRTLDLLAFGNQRYETKNKVTITREHLYDILRRDYPELEVIASCIQQLDPGRTEDYGDKLKKYDGVVILNQHTTPEFLRQYEEHAGKMIAFLNLQCNRTNLYKCLLHYLRIEQGCEHNSELEYCPAANELDITPCQIESSERVSLTDHEALTETLIDVFEIDREEDPCLRGDLAHRAYDLSGLIKMGIRTFKLPRGIPVKWDELEVLRDHIKTYAPDEPKIATPTPAEVQAYS